jgi:two-component system, cell cycle response regulator DivK
MNVASKRVLLVEDNPDNRYLATLLLEGEGFEVFCAVNGTEALAAIAQEQFVFVVLDLQLPDFDGFEIATRIRELASAEELPIVVVSAFTTREARRKALAAGCSGYLEKPIDAECFVSQVRCLAGLMPL